MTGTRPEQPEIHPLVLKHQSTFGVFDDSGDIVSDGRGEQGLYHHDTRHLSRLVFIVGGRRPLLLSSTVSHGNFLLGVDLACSDSEVEWKAEGNAVHIFRGRFLRDAGLYEEMRFRNYANRSIVLPCRVEFAVDFRDLFEVRGEERSRRGQQYPVRRTEPGDVVLEYRGLDGIQRETEIRLEGGDVRVGEASLDFSVELEPDEERIFHLTVCCRRFEEGASVPSSPCRRDPRQENVPDWYAGIRDSTVSEADLRRRRFATVSSSNELFNDWWNRSIDDVNLLLSDFETGSYPMAGIPWFAAPFGRDGIITALQVLWIAPFVARGVLNFLAENQSREHDPERDAEPGKILHEARGGEMANLGEVPFGRYYGSLDSTPLFVLLAAAYWQRTGDEATLRSLLPSIEAAIGWMNEHGDRDGDGLLEYERKEPGGLENQSWKDSRDSMFHADGSLVRGPVAPVEVQAYAVAARSEIAEVFRALGRTEAAELEERAARRLRELVETRFWSGRLGTYVMALDGEKRPLRVRSSNAGHVLFAGAASQSRAERVAASLMSEHLFSGWGVRTVGAREARYNPMSYHNGSVWPHDTAMAAYGMSRYGLTTGSMRLLSSLFDASLFFPDRRLPELFCGFHRRSGEAPVSYPVACRPQAWAAGAVSMLVQAGLGVRIDALDGVVAVHRPRLPDALNELIVRNLLIGSARVDLAFSRVGTRVEARVLQRSGGIQTRVSQV